MLFGDIVSLEVMSVTLSRSVVKSFISPNYVKMFNDEPFFKMDANKFPKDVVFWNLVVLF